MERREMEGRNELVVVVVGTSRCGKTKLIQKFATDTFIEVSWMDKHLGILVNVCFSISEIFPHRI